MSKKIKDLNKEIMNKIHQNKIKMKPRYYFVLASIMTFIGLLSAVIVTTLSMSMIMFLLKAKGPGAGFRFQMMLDNFPIWLIIVAGISFFAGIWTFKKYNFTYKFNFKFLAIIFVLLIVLSSWLINILGFTELFIKRGPMRQSIQKYLQIDSTEEHVPGSGWERQFK